MRTVHALNALLLIGLIGFSVYVYPDLPERIPMHFGASGEADRWATRTMLSWLLLPLIGVVVVALMYAIGWFLPTHPQLLNMPNREKLLELSPERQRWVLQGMANTMYILVLVTLVMFCVLQYGAYQTAINDTGRNTILLGIVTGLVLMPIVSIGMIVVMQKRMDTAWREHRARRDTTTT